MAETEASVAKRITRLRREIEEHNRRYYEEAAPIISGRDFLWHHSKREIIAGAAFVARLEIVATGREGRAIGQVDESASNWVRRGVANGGKEGAARQPLVCDRLEVKLRPGFDAHALGDYLIGCGVRSVELVAISAISFEGECGLRCERARMIRSGGRRNSGRCFSQRSTGWFSPARRRRRLLFTLSFV
jgi:hypothetical protein